MESAKSSLKKAKAGKENENPRIQGCLDKAKTLHVCALSVAMSGVLGPQ